MVSREELEKGLRAELDSGEFYQKSFDSAATYVAMAPRTRADLQQMLRGYNSNVRHYEARYLRRPSVGMRAHVVSQTAHRDAVAAALGATE